MDVRTGGTAEIKFFLSTLNDMLTELADDGQSKMFNPEKIMVNEAGANMTGVFEEFGEDYYRNKIVTCKWHFTQDVQCHANKVSSS